MGHDTIIRYRWPDDTMRSEWPACALSLQIGLVIKEKQFNEDSAYARRTF